jgi:hypothetical protein
VGKVLDTKLGFGRSFGMSLEGDYHELDVTNIWGFKLLLVELREKHIATLKLI